MSRGYALVPCYKVNGFALPLLPQPHPMLPGIPPIVIQVHLDKGQFLMGERSDIDVNLIH